MEIVFFHRNPKAGYSIYRGFEPMINSLKETDDVKEYFVPEYRANPLSLIKNIRFVYKNRTNKGVNHITGDIHYCMLGLVGVPSVLTIHDNYSVLTAKHGILDKLLKAFLWIFLPTLISRKCVFITPTTKKEVMKYSVAKKVCVITHQAVEKDFCYTPTIFNSACPHILHMGTMPHKNLETTLKALEGFNCHLTVIQKMTEEQVALADSLKIQYRNVYNLTNDEILKEYVNCDIVVFPTLREGLGAPTIEGQAVGRPVITTNKEPMSWVAGDGALLLNNPLDPEELRKAIMLLCHDEKKRADLVNKGQKNIKRFSLEDIIRQYKLIYSEVTNNI